MLSNQRADERVDGEEAGAEDEDQQGGEPVGVGRGAVEVAGIGEDVARS